MAFARQTQPVRDQSGNTFQLAIKGWTTSKLSATKDQGLQSLLGFLEKKSSRNILSHRLAGRTVLLITINEHDKDRFYHLNNFTWAGATLTVEDSRPPRNQHAHAQNQHQSFEGRISQPSRNGFPRDPRRTNTNNLLTSEIENIIISVIRKRYHAGDRHLILNAMVADPELLSSGLSDQDASKVYKAIFTICESKIWETETKRTEAVLSVSLRDNAIKTVQDIISLASVFPHIHNLDLANNNLEDLGALKFWKNQFRELEHLILTGNPVASKPDTLQTLIKWYPNLKMYNNEPIASNGTQLQPQPQPEPQPIGAMAAPAPLHPELPPGSTFGVAQPDKPAEVLLREQMGLQFSFETRLKLQWVENCLTANNWDYALAMANFSQLKAQGQIPLDAFLEGV
ncbi:hypothetical protein A1O3_03999 [Capronia epimyces CBS 606.96]|uniref:mRNA export factor MEX67 n=1 Tax=Capronia epimyces CBS 606.96 TaxID=1182542 RepID=W9Y2K8_9EURO|nr:uncharacterized protein A1O3_03999 [Capronia epimyces CBS 606.96]EXJ87042.1 hypothetical protein A1O3_03999 [Capronia epimyces CBS 606.96]